MDELSQGPLVSFLLFTYNQNSYIREAVEGALSQDYQNLEIIISDDCSSDTTFDIIKTMTDSYLGPHRVLINRNSNNLGLAQHFSGIVAIAKGSIIVVAAGDDISVSDRVSKTVYLLNKYPDVSMVSFSDVVINNEGVVVGPVYKKKSKCVYRVSIKEYISGYFFQLSGASRGFRKNIFNVFGPLKASCPTEDTPYLLRGLMLGDALVSPDIGIMYRIHDRNLSGPQSLPYLSVEKIVEQYICDIDVAFENNIISMCLKKEIFSWVVYTGRKRLLSNSFFLSDRKLKYFFHKIVLSSDLNIKEKLFFLRRAFLS